MPEELTLKPEDSFVYESEGIKSGILHFSGGVEAESLSNFFQTYLVQDGWTYVGSAKFKRMVLSFAKPDRTCQIIIDNKTFTTDVDILVQPYKIK